MRPCAAGCACQARNILLLHGAAGVSAWRCGWLGACVHKRQADCSAEPVAGSTCTVCCMDVGTSSSLRTAAAGRHAAGSRHSGAVTLYLHVSQVLTGFEKRTNRVAFTDNNATLLSAGEDGCVRRWDVEVCCFAGNCVGLPHIGFGPLMRGDVFAMPRPMYSVKLLRKRCCILWATCQCMCSPVPASTLSLRSAYLRRFDAAVARARQLGAGKKWARLTGPDDHGAHARAR
jgi:hypothetical protein